MEDIIYIACDDSGLQAKEEIIHYLQEHHYEYLDCGSGAEASRYPYYAAKVAAAVSQGKIRRGILICASGIGMSIAANKFRGVRASLVTDPYAAQLTRRHNNANVLCLGGQMSGPWTICKILENWLTTDYEGGKHQGSLDLIAQMEAAMMGETRWCPEEIPYPSFSWKD